MRGGNCRHRLRHVASVQDTELRLFQQLAKWRNIAEHGRQARAHRFDRGDAKAFMTRQANIVARLRHQLGQLRIAGIGDDADAFGNPLLARQRFQVGAAEVILAPGNHQAPFRMARGQSGKQVQRFLQSLVRRPAPEIHDARQLRGGTLILVLFHIDAVFNHRQARRLDDLAEQIAIVVAGADHARIGVRGGARDGMEEDRLQARGKAGMKEAAMGGGKQRTSVQPLGGGQEIIGKIDAMHVHHVIVAQQPHHAGRERIACGARVGNADHAHAIDHLFCRQDVGRVHEYAVQRDDGGNVAVATGLVMGNILYDIFHATDRWIVLANNMCNFNRHNGLSRQQIGRSAAERSAISCRARRNSRARTRGRRPTSARTGRYR